MENLSPWMQLAAVVVASISAVLMIRRSTREAKETTAETTAAIGKALSDLQAQATIVASQVEAMGTLVKDLAAMIEKLDKRVNTLELDRAFQRGRESAGEA